MSALVPSKSSSILFTTITLCGFLFSSPAPAADAPGKNATWDPVLAQLQSPDAAQNAAGIAALHALVRKEPINLLDGHSDTAIARLAALGKEADVDQLFVDAFNSRPGSTDIMTRILRKRVEHLLATHQNQPALEQAKVYYNFCPMGNTADAILLLMQALRAAYPNDPVKAETFKSEQTAGVQASDPPVPQTILAGVKVDGSAYDKAIAGRTAEDFETLTARGNLLLLADRPREAREIFQHAYDLADEQQVMSASENIARAMRAEDGCIGRANAWVLSIRPKLTGTNPAG